MNHWAWKVLGTVTALFAAGAAIAFFDKLLTDQQNKIDQDLADAQADALDAAAQALDDAEAAQQEEAAPEESAPEETAPEAAGRFAEAGPNPNPVLAGKPEAPLDADGKLDPTRLCSPEDFANWEDLGCQG